MELAVDERTVSGKRARRLRQQGIIPANVYGQNLPSLPLQVNGLALEKLLGHGGAKVILSLKVGNEAPIQAMIKEVHHDPRGGAITHVDFYRVAATEKLKSHIQLHFVNEVRAADLDDVVVFRPLNEVVVECVPGDLPATIQVDLSRLRQVGDVIRVGDLAVGPGVTILTDHNELVAGVHPRPTKEKAEVVEGKAEVPVAGPGTPAGGTERQ